MATALLKGPSNLAEDIRESAVNDTFGYPPAPFILSDKLSLLVDAAFYASMLAEEGRYPRFRIVYHRDPLPLAALFDGSIPLDAESLRRLAPTVSDPACALCLAPDCSEGVACVGITHLRPLWQPRFVGFSQSRVGHSVIDLVLSVEGPGHLRACVNTREVCVLHGGEIRSLRPIIMIDAFLSLMHQILKHLFANADTEILKYCGGPEIPSCVEDLAGVWSEVLDATLDLGHGGVFVVLPHECTRDLLQIEREYGIRCKYKFYLDLGQAYLRWVRASAKLWRFEFDNRETPVSPEGLQEYKGLHNVCVNAEEDLKDTIRAVARLSSTDGCVVLDRSLTVRGFGGEIRESGSDQKYRPLYRGNTDEVIPAERIEAYGMRHRSACRFSQRHGDVYLFVISQDKELRLFHSEMDRANQWDNLDAKSFQSKLD